MSVLGCMHLQAGLVEQNDRFVGELTTRETLDFAARCQGGGQRAGERTAACQCKRMQLFPDMPLMSATDKGLDPIVASLFQRECRKPFLQMS